VANARVSGPDRRAVFDCALQTTLNALDLLIVEAKLLFVSRENLFALSDRICETALIVPMFN
jgi:hypothetical protein